MRSPSGISANDSRDPFRVQAEALVRRGILNCPLCFSSISPTEQITIHQRRSIVSLYEPRELCETLSFPPYAAIAIIRRWRMAPSYNCSFPSFVLPPPDRNRYTKSTRTRIAEWLCVVSFGVVLLACSIRQFRDGNEQVTLDTTTRVPWSYRLSPSRCRQYVSWRSKAHHGVLRSFPSTYW